MSADSFKTVLLVDDEPSLLRLCEQILTLAGYRVLAANGGEEALRIVENEDVHVALLDVTLPEMNGFELARRLQQRDSNIRVLFMSGYGPEEITALVDLSHFVLAEAIHNADPNRRDRKCAGEVNEHRGLTKDLDTAGQPPSSLEVPPPPIFRLPIC